MAIAEPKPQELVGREWPRVAPPRPLKSRIDEFKATANTLGITLIPWQEVAALYLYAVGPDGKWLYPEDCDVVSRQNGKTEILVPHIVTRLRAGRRVMHTAQDRTLPREVFERVVEAMMENFRSEVRGKPRLANGQESIRTINGGRYRIVAPTRGGARGPSNDDLIVDEVRELDDFEFMAAAEPTLTASEDPQALFLSNAGADNSVVLNALRLRAQTDPSLAYLEWSAAPERTADDRAGWAEANPSIGHLPGILPYLERKHTSYSLSGTMAIFETEHLCRWVSTMREQLVDGYAWQLCHDPELEAARRPSMAVSMSPDGKRASAAIAWMRPDNTVGLRLIYNVPGDPIDTALLGTDLKQAALKLGIKEPGYDPLTDKELAKYFKKSKAITGRDFANASAQFANLVASGHLKWADADAVTDDLTWTSRKQDRETGTYQAVRAQDDRSITASLAAIRAVWLASGPKPAVPKVM